MSIAGGFGAGVTLLHVLADDTAEEEIFREEVSAARMMRKLVPADSERADHAPWATLPRVIRNVRCPVFALRVKLARDQRKRIPGISHRMHVR
jgi:hypothetical protein